MWGGGGGEEKINCLIKQELFSQVIAGSSPTIETCYACHHGGCDGVKVQTVRIEQTISNSLAKSYITGHQLTNNKQQTKTHKIYVLTCQ
jgi:hypothetical protein